MGLIQQNVAELNNQLRIKERNMKRLFDLIYAHGKISRAQLAAMTKLSPTTVSSLVDEMIANEIVIASGMEDTNRIGRKAILLQINPDKLQIPTIAWERTGFKYVLYDLACNELERLYMSHSQSANYAQELHNIITSKSKLIKPDRLGALCITLPAVVDVHMHRIISTVLDVQGQEDFLPHIKDHFLVRPVVVGNESAFYAYAEKEFALSSPAENVMYINVNIGVGAGIIYRGKIYRGSFGMAGEFGHMSVDMNGPVCSCGNRGCLERLISTPRIVERAVQEASQDRRSLLYTFCEGDLESATLDQVAQAFIAGDPAVSRAIEQSAEILSFGIANAIRIFDPEILIIGGGIEILGPKFLEMVRRMVNMNGTSVLASSARIDYTKLDPICKTRGAAKYYIDNLMRMTTINEEDVIVC